MSAADWAVGYQRLRSAVSSGASFQPSSAIVLFGMGTVGSVIAQAGLFESFDNFQRSLLTAVLLNVTMSLVVLGVYLLWFEGGAPRPFAAVVALSAILGAGRIGLGQQLQHALGIPSLMDSWLGYLAGGVQGLLWLFAMSLFFQDRERFTEQREALLQELAENRMRERRGELLTNAITQELATSVEARVAASVSVTRSDVLSALTYTDSAVALRSVATSLREAVDRDIRPMSHELWEGRSESDTHMSWVTLLRIACYQQPFAIVVTTVFTIALGFPVALSMQYPMQALASMAVQVTCGALVAQWLDRRFRQPGRADAGAYWASLLVLALVVTIPTMPLRLLGWPIDNARLWSLSALIGYPMLMLFSNIVTGLTGTREAVLERVRGIVDDAAVAREVRARELQLASQRLARHLHSSLQGRLMALSLELEQAAEQGRTETTTEVLQRLNALLEAPLVGALQQQAVDVEPALRALIAEWSVVSDVQLRYELPEAGPLEQGELIVGIAEEAIANAIRHGHATQIRLHVAADQANVVMTIENDGDVRPIGEPGMGSRWLDQVSNRDWNLEPSPNRGMRLRVRLPNLLPVEQP